MNVYLTLFSAIALEVIGTMLLPASQNFSKFIPTIYFGIFTGIAMLLAMISVLTLLPALILMIKPFGKTI